MSTQRSMSAPFWLAIDDETRVRIGRFLAGISVVLGLAGTLTVMVMGRWDFLIRDFVAHNAVLAVGFGSLGWIVLASQPRNGAVWALTWSAVFASAYVIAEAGWLFLARDSVPDISWEAIQDLSLSELSTSAALVASPGTWSWIPAFFLMLTLGLLLFPDGKVPGPRWRWVGWASIAAIAVVSSAQAWLFGPNSTIHPSASFEEYPGVAGNVVEYGFILVLLSAVLSITALVVRYRRSSGEIRRQILLIALGGASLTTALVVGSIMDAVVTDPGPLFDYVALVGEALLILSFAIAILKYRLYDIDVVVSKTVTYVALAAFIAAVYVGLVVGIGVVIGSESSFGLSIAATVLVAMTFQPARRWVQRAANRLVYGDRATPYEVLARFSHRASETSDEELIARVPQMIADGTGADQAMLWVRSQDGFRIASSWPEKLTRRVSGTGEFGDPEADFSLSISHEAELMGGVSLILARGETITPGEVELLADLSQGLGLALRNARLTTRLRRQVEDLERSRDRLVSAADEARRSLEHDLDSGPQQQLVAIKVKLGPIRRMAEQQGAEKTARVLADIETQAGDAIQAIRDFAAGIYPPLLEAEGLAVALGHQAHKAALPISVHANAIGRYARDKEAAVYFTVLEALQNTAKYADASSASITLLERDDELRFEVQDDGRGFDPGAADAGAGLEGMADRIDTVGGSLDISSSPATGTVVSGSIPLTLDAGHAPRLEMEPA